MNGGVEPKSLIDQKNNIEKRLNNFIAERDKFFDFETDNEKPKVVF